MKTLLCLFALVAVSVAFVARPLEDSALNCLMCEVGVRAAENPADREAHTVEDKFDAECKKEFGAIPFIEKDCEKYGNSKLDPIINELEGGTAPEDVCEKLKECPKKN
ncbi:CBN-SPP-14 protein [Caenorhabditis brenneri]|uniref:CBN-SPP-14 protein n=1 Tax=Caenorhabditis brenneri TaxID=135651 RepID=G0MWJ4_CAEBE|nr:CBN-SPP-14 protein [Caenorhabditis brenneri]